MKNLNQEIVEHIRKEYPIGARVKLIRLNDPYNTSLTTGSMGTIVKVDDIGTIHVAWDCGSSLGVIYDEDLCHVLDADSI